MDRRFLSLSEAAAYVGVGQDLFAAEVEAGMWPRPLRRGRTGRRLTWDRKLLDARADALGQEHGGAPQPPPAPDAADLGHQQPAGPASREAELLRRIASRHDGQAAAGRGRARRT